jgi:hypothetical protein
VETWFGPAERAHARQFAEKNLRSTSFLGSLARINGWMNRVAILAAFALLDAQHHAFGVDIGYL